MKEKNNTTSKTKKFKVSKGGLCEKYSLKTEQGLSDVMEIWMGKDNANSISFIEGSIIGCNSERRLLFNHMLSLAYWAGIAYATIFPKRVECKIKSKEDKQKKEEELLKLLDKQKPSYFG